MRSVWLLLVLLIPFSGASARRIDAAQTVLIGFDVDRYPFSYTDLNRHSRAGFDYDYARALCDDMKISCLYVFGAHKDLLSMVKDGRVHMLIAGMTKTPVLEESLVFSDPYYSDHSLFVSTKPLGDEVTAAQLRNAEVGVRLDSLQHMELQPVVTRGDVRSLKIFSDYSSMFRALRRGELDYIYLDSRIGYERIKLEPPEDDLYFCSRHTLYPLTAMEARMAVTRENSDFMVRVNESIDRLKHNGVHQRLSLKYFPFLTY